jgi:phosphinothricin acetyltransferase
MIRPVQVSDAPAIARIYQPYVTNTTISFETEPPSVDEIAARIQRITMRHSWLVYESEGALLGYAYTSSFRERPAYQSTVESTIYLDQAAIGRGIGQGLYQALLDDAARKRYREALGVIALPNELSIKLHEKLGFFKAAHLEKIGCKFDQWIDVSVWQKHLTTSASPPRF